MITKKLGLAGWQEEKARLELRVGELEGALATENRRVTYYKDQVNRATELLKRERDSQAAPFTRQDLEGMTRLRLVSLIEEAINEARRKGLIEAEGLVARHRILEQETDLEVLRGVVQKYQERISEIERRLKTATEQAKTAVKLDTRPLQEKFTPAGIGPARWWSEPPRSQQLPRDQFEWLSAVKKEQPASGFPEFDKKAKEVSDLASRRRTLKEGGHVVVAGTSGGTYILRHTSADSDTYSCTCPSWQFQKEPSEQRTCKHLMNLLGVVNETARIAAAKVKAKEAAEPQRCHCGIVLVRGQCEKHTRDWKGDEKCACGRKFASCKAAYDTISVAQRKYGHQPTLARYAESNISGVRF